MSPTPARRKLGPTDLQVYPLNLGGNVFGWTADRSASFDVLDAYRAAGGNFIDTADVYNRWAPGHRGGESEQVIGEWLRERGCRAEMVLATKVGMGGPEVGEGLRKDQILRGCELSLKRLGVEQIDLFYAHKDDAKTPLEETLGAFDALVRSGKVRWIGASNYSAPRLQAALETSAKNGLARFAVFQPEYSLVARKQLDGAVAELCQAHGLGVCTYFALASGFLTGKYAPGKKTDSEREDRVQAYLENPRAMAALEAARGVAAKHGATVAQVALAWQMHHPVVTTPIASATSTAQIRELVGAVELSLDAEDLAKLNAANPDAR